MRRELFFDRPGKKWDSITIRICSTWLKFILMRSLLRKKSLNSRRKGEDLNEFINDVMG